jgi:hypothetical protein
MKLHLAIRAYKVGAVFDNYDDGTSQSFDAVTADIVGGDRDGQRLRILVESRSALVREWNKPGETIVASVEPVRLGSQILFATAFRLEAGGS